MHPDSDSTAKIEIKEYDAVPLKRQFENGHIIRGKRDHAWDINDSYVSVAQPICDIFYLLQCIMPGFIDSRGLPRPEWLAWNEDCLRDIFDDDGYEDLYEAAQVQKKAYKCTSIPRPHGYYGE